MFSNTGPAALLAVARTKTFSSYGGTIIAVGVGPFIQQMPTIQNNLVLSDTPVTITQVQSYIISSDGVWADALPANDWIAAVCGAVLVFWTRTVHRLPIMSRTCWTALPAVLTIVTIGFLVLTVVTTTNSKVDVWKLSNIPMLCFQPDRDVQDELRCGQDPMTMENVSSKMSVKLVKGENQDRQLTKQ